MPRATITEVTKIHPTSITEEEVLAFIGTANVLVNTHLGTEGLDSALLTQIERYVSAHLVALRDRRVSKEAADGVSVEYEMGEMGTGLEATPYGQTALMLDPTGILARLTEPDLRRTFLYRAGAE